MTEQFKTNRRVFMLQAVTVAGVASLMSVTQAAETVSENDPQAKSLAYKADASKVDKAAQPMFVAGENCGNCQLFHGKATDATGSCSLFGGKHVSSKGWCSAYAKKA
jgi:High potential iron-sulfur protein